MTLTERLARLHETLTQAVEDLEKHRPDLAARIRAELARAAG